MQQSCDDCTDLMNTDTHIHESARQTEVFDNSATFFLFPLNSNARPHKRTVFPKSQCGGQPKLSPTAMALSLHAKHEPTWKLLEKCTDRTVILQPVIGMDTDRGLHECIASTAGHRSVFEAEVQLVTTTSIKQQSSARNGREET